jgi:hypothetical protein
MAQYVACPLLFGMALLFLRSGVSWQDLWLFWVLILSLGTMQIAAPYLERRQLQRVYNETPSLRGPQVYHFSDTGLAITGGSTTVKLEWDAILEAVETKELFLLFTSRRWAHYLPKRAIGDPAEEGELRRFLSNRLGGRMRAAEQAAGADR